MMHAREESASQTYAGLRLAMFFFVILLFASIVAQIVSSGCFQSSISAYYYTPVRSVFVAALCAIGACLIIYQGNTDAENALLDFSGFLAFIVAFVPTEINRNACGITNLPLEEEAAVSAAVRNNAGVVLLVGILAAVVASWLSSGRYASGGQPSRLAKIAVSASLVALVVGFAWYLVAPEAFERFGHETAAIALFMGILAVILLNGFDKRSSYRREYRLIAVGMLVLGIALFLARWLLGDSFVTFVFWLEAELIFGFAIYWLTQTCELGGYVDRASLHSTRADHVDQAAASEGT